MSHQKLELVLLGASSGLIPRIESLSPTLKEKYQKEIYILTDLIFKNSAYIGPVKIVEFLFDTDPEFLNYWQNRFNEILTKELILNLKQNLISPSKFTEAKPDLNKYALTTNISNKHFNFFNIIAGITKAIVTYLNISEKYNFQDLISAALSEGFIQIHMIKTPTSGSTIKNIMFEIKATKNKQYKIKLDYGTNYQADRCQGKIKFKISH